MGHVQVDMVSSNISASILDGLYMVEYLLLLFHWPDKIRLAQYFDFFPPKLYLILAFLDVENFFENVLEYLKINFVASSSNFLSVYLLKVLFFQRKVKILGQFEIVTNRE